MNLPFTERRANPNPFDVGGILATLYTIGFLAMVGLLYFIEIPEKNEKALLQLFGLMSAIQMALISFYYGSSRNAEATQRAIEQRQGRSEAVVQEIAKTVPIAAAAAASTGGNGGAIKTESVEVTANTATLTEAPPIAVKPAEGDTT